MADIESSLDKSSELFVKSGSISADSILKLKDISLKTA